MLRLPAPDAVRAPPPNAADQARLAREYGALAQARIANSWVRLGGCAIVASLTVLVTGEWGALIWLGGLAPVLLIERTAHTRVLRACEAGRPPQPIWPLAAWTALQSAYANIIAALLWFATYVHGETLAVIYMLGGLANAAATLRGSNALALAGLIPTILFLLGLPLVDYWLGRNPYDLMPVVGGLLFIAFGVNLWRSLREADAAQARAETAALRERQAAAAAAAAKSDTIRRMRDELRTPMTALIGAAEHLRRVAVSPEARVHIGTLAQAGEVLRAVLDDLQDLDRLENDQVRIETKPTDPRELVRGVIGAFRAAAQDKGLELFLDIDPNTPAQVEIDAVRVRQILFNLLANAVKYTMHGGVRVKLQTQATEDPANVRLGFAIADTGIGMSRSQLAMIFGRGKLCEEGEGPGLGLAISLRLARLMGGKLAAKSELGEGSVFSFVIEAKRVEAAGLSAA